MWGSHLTKDHQDAMTVTCIEIGDEATEAGSTLTGTPSLEGTTGSETTRSSANQGTSSIQHGAHFAGLLQDFY